MTAVEYLAEKYNYITWLRNRDEISAGMADKWRKHYLDQAIQMQKQQRQKVDKLLDTLLENNMCSHAGDKLIEQFKTENK